MVNKKAWIRITEAAIAILIVTSVLLVMYSRQPQRTDLSDRIYDIQREVLQEISTNSTLRTKVLNSEHGDTDTLNDFANNSIIPLLDFEITICNLTLSCKMKSETLIQRAYRKDVYVEDTIIASQIYPTATYSPKKVRLFIWEK